MRFSPIFAVLLTTVASPALDFGNGFYVTGTAELEYNDGNLFADGTFGRADIDLGYEQVGGGFGGFIGVDAFSFDGTSGTQVYGALTYSGGFGKVQFGVPRNALDDYLLAPSVGGLELLELQSVSILTGSIIPTYLLSGNIDPPLGAR